MIAAKFKMFKMTGRIIIISTVLFCAGSAFGQDPAKKDSVSTIPAEVMTVIKASCMPCHSNEGRDKPKAKVNFSVWEQYSPMEKTMLAGSILDEVKKKEMPPKRFLESHPDAALTEAQINQIVQWCDSLKAKP
jgi:hypothetical protein